MNRPNHGVDVPVLPSVADEATELYAERRGGSHSMLPKEPAAIQHPTTPVEDLRFVSEVGALWDDLDTLRETMKSDTHLQGIVVGTVLTGTVSLPAGYVVWTIRGGMILTSLVAQMPAWRMIDPLPVLEQAEKDFDRKQRIHHDDEGESLESIIDEAVA